MPLGPAGNGGAAPRAAGGGGDRPAGHRGGWGGRGGGRRGGDRERVARPVVGDARERQQPVVGILEAARLLERLAQEVEDRRALGDRLVGVRVAAVLVGPDRDQVLLVAVRSEQP